MEVTAAVMKATAADTRANGLEERTNQAEGAVKTLQESARISDIRMAELVQTNSCQLSDFGSSNFARQVTTVGPGNYSYAAPKSSDCSLQSPKMDAFSYGILVLEMACGQFPEVQKRLDVMKRLQWSAMKILIEQCSARSPGRRSNCAVGKGFSLKIVKKLPGSDKVEGFEEGPCAVATHDFTGSATDTAYLAAQAKITAVKSGPHCVAFDTEKGDELTFVTGDVIELLGRVDQDWLRGRLGGKEGLFPAQFVEIKIDLHLQLLKFPQGAEKEQDVGVVSTVPAEKVTVVMTWLVLCGE
eukprot:Em0019g401a